MRRRTLLILTTSALGCPAPEPPALDAGGLADASRDAGLADAQATDVTADAPDAPDVGAPGPDPLESFSWPQPSYPAREGAFWSRHPRVGAHVSAWVGRAQGEQRPDLDAFAVGARGALAVGSGHAAALVGIDDPRNTLHAIVGPTYQRRGGHFGDVSMHLEVGGARVGFEQEWLAQSFGAPAVLWRGDRGDLSLEVVVWAPSTSEAALGCVLQLATLTHAGGADSEPVAVAVEGFNTPEPGAPAEVLHWVTSARSLTTRRLGGPAARGSDGALRADLGALGPGEERTLAWSHCAREGGEVDPARALDADALLESEADAWAAWYAGVVALEVPEQAVADLVAQAAVTLRVQLGARGGLTQLHRYSGAWMRDTIGAALGLVALGAREDARAAVDYVFGAMLQTGDFANSWAADLEVDPGGPQPDWASLGPLPARVQAESPSYFVWMHEHVWRAGAPDPWLRARRGALERALDAQAFDPATGLLPFSGDETFRVGMNVALGYALEHPHEETSLSLNSSALWVGAARRLARAWRDLGDLEAADALDARADVALSDALAGFSLGDGCYGASRERGAAAPTAPYEDASLKLVWAGALAPGDPVAAAQLGCLVGRLQVEPGVLQSTPHPMFRALTRVFGGGIYTGMLPGYTLSVLSRMGHPDAGKALLGLGRAADEVGAFQEYHRDSDHSGVTLLYDRTGQGINQTPKFRSWEAGVNVAALLEHLTGWSADAPRGRVRIAPSLPDGWPQATYRRLRAGDDRFDLEVERDGTSLVVRVRAHEANARTWAVALDSEVELSAGEVAEWR